jgi:hypothetical protein
MRNDAIRFNGRKLLAAPIMALDQYLRRRQGITEFSNSRDCLLRMQIVESEEEVALCDGARLAKGDYLVELHIWNEHVPLIPREGVTWAWAQQMNKMIEISLRELARHLKGRRDLDNVRVIRGRIGLAALREDQIARLAGRFGFERRQGPDQPAAKGLHWFGENILISMLVLSRNPSALRINSLWRRRMLVYLSRRSLERRYSSPCRSEPSS